MQKQAVRRILSLVLMVTVLFASLSFYAVPAQALEEEALYAAESATSEVLNIRFYFQHYIDTHSFPQATHRVYITNAVSFTNIIYHSFVQRKQFDDEYSNDNFSVGFSTTGSYSNDDITNMGACTIGVNLPCASGSCGDHSQHHKSVDRISDVLLADRDEDTSARQFSVLWCDREAGIFCACDYGDHEYLSAYAVVLDNSPVIQILCLSGDNSENIAMMSILLAHESAHCLGMNDAYGTTNHARDGVFDCLMDYLELNRFDANDLYDEMRAHPLDAFCESCENALYNLFANKYRY